MHESGSFEDAIAKSLTQAEVEEVLIFPWVSSADGLVRDDRVTQAIGRRGEHAKRASQLHSIDIEVMTRRELVDQIHTVRNQFLMTPGATFDLADRLVENGIIYMED